MASYKRTDDPTRPHRRAVLYSSLRGTPWGRMPYKLDRLYAAWRTVARPGGSWAGAAWLGSTWPNT